MLKWIRAIILISEIHPIIRLEERAKAFKQNLFMHSEN